MVLPSLHRRHAWVSALAICLAVVVTLAFAATAHAQQEVGLQTHLMWGGVSDADVDGQLDKAKQGGATIVRVDVGWASIEPDGKGQYNQWYLDRLDKVVDKARARGIKVLLTFWETPCWASSAPETLKQGCGGQWWNRGVQRYTPNNAQDFADGLAYVVDRYKGRVTAWEIWNEPNDTAYYKADDPVSRYAELVKAGYPAAKAADPGATILGGSLAHADFGWTEKLLQKGVGGNFDAWSVHPYPGPRSPLDLGDPGWAQASFRKGVPEVRATLLRHGQDKPIWLTEFGWSTCSVRDGEEWARCIDPQTQATYVDQALNLMRTWDYVKAGFYFKLQDTDDDASDRNTNYGLLRHDGSEKPAFAAFSKAARDVSAGLLPSDETGSGSASGSGSGSGAGSGSGFGADIKTDRFVTLKASRKGKRVKVTGSGPRGRIVRVSAYRYNNKRRTFDKRRSYTVKVRVNRRGRYSRILRKKALRTGRWRITARLTGMSNPRLARADLGKKRKQRSR